MASGSDKASSGVAHGTIHGRTKGAPAHLTLAQLFPSTHAPGLSRGSKGKTKHGKVGVHGRGRLPVDHLPSQALKDPWGHKDQAAGGGVKR